MRRVSRSVRHARARVAVFWSAMRNTAANRRSASGPRWSARLPHWISSAGASACEARWRRRGSMLHAQKELQLVGQSVPYVEHGMVLIVWPIWRHALRPICWVALQPSADLGGRSMHERRPNSVSPQSQVCTAYFLAVRLSARVIDFACLLGRGMAEPVDATR
jgi:hypothetical protein